MWLPLFLRTSTSNSRLGGVFPPIVDRSIDRPAVRPVVRPSVPSVARPVGTPGRGGASIDRPLGPGAGRRPWRHNRRRPSSARPGAPAAHQPPAGEGSFGNLEPPAAGTQGQVRSFECPLAGDGAGAGAGATQRPRRPRRATAAPGAAGAHRAHPGDLFRIRDPARSRKRPGSEFRHCTPPLSRRTPGSEFSTLRARG